MFGYQAGCEFTLGTHQEALSAPNAARYLCKKQQKNTLECLADYSGEGICHRSELWDGFYRSQPVRVAAELIQGRHTAKMREIPDQCDPKKIAQINQSCFVW